MKGKPRKELGDLHGGTAKTRTATPTWDYKVGVLISSEVEEMREMKIYRVRGKEKW